MVAQRGTSFFFDMDDPSLMPTCFALSRIESGPAAVIGRLGSAPAPDDPALSIDEVRDGGR